MSNGRGEGELNPTTHYQEKIFPVIPEVPPILSKYLLEDFSEGRYEDISTPNDGVWKIDHYKNSNEKKIICVYPTAYFDKDTIKSIVLNDNIREIGRIISENTKNIYKPMNYAIKDEDGNWTILSLDQIPNDLLP